MLNQPARRHDDRLQPVETTAVRVLVVDDDENFRAWLTQLMRRLGFVVETADDGEQALSCLRAAPFDLLVSDHAMPRLDGFDLIRAVRADPALSDQYAVMLTASDDVESKVAALTIGYDDFLAKSCTEVEVVAKVVAARRVVSRQRVLEVAARKWEALATRDELTGVSTRRTLFEEAERHLRDGTIIGIAIIDLDGFKPINDTFGHLTGDRILRDLGTMFLDRSRANDVIARYGGDEFLLLVVNQPLDDVSGAAERMLAEIEKLEWTEKGTTFRVSATSGVAHSSLIPHAKLEQLLDTADRDLYAKKWLKKHPGAPETLYEYPGRVTGGAIVHLT
jgi:two-component system, cell cycle response regulator